MKENHKGIAQKNKKKTTTKNKKKNDWKLNSSVYLLGSDFLHIWSGYT